MDRLVRDLSVTLLPSAEFARADDYEEMMCGCGTNCTVCTGTGTKGCEKIVGDDALDTLRNALSQ